MMDRENQGGFGIVSKEVMHTKGVSIKAKGLYSFLCSYADKDGVCFPSVNNICKSLEISEKRFRKYLAELVAHGIVEVERERIGNFWSRNIYHLNDDIRTGQFGPIQNVMFDTDDSGGSKTGGSRNGCVENGRVQNGRAKNTSRTNPVKENHGNKHTQSNTGLCKQVCDLLNRRRSFLKSKGRVKVTSLAEDVINRLLNKGMTENDILGACKEFCKVINADWRVTFDEFEEYCDNI